MLEPDELADALESLGLTDNQRNELATDPERASSWIEWARQQSGIRNPAALILSKFRTGDWAPDPNGWRGDTAGIGPNYAKALKACEALVASCGHEYLDDALAAELDRLCGLPKVGNGATLTDADRDRLLAKATRMRDRQAKVDTSGDEMARTVAYYTRLVKEKRMTVVQMRQMEGRDPARWPAVCDAVERATRRLEVAA